MRKIVLFAFMAAMAIPALLAGCNKVGGGGGGSSNDGGGGLDTGGGDALEDGYIAPNLCFDIACGGSHTIACKPDGTVWTWGRNQFGQLGLNTTDDSLIPKKVQGLAKVIAVAAGDNHSVALRDNGSVWTWGANYAGQLGVPIEDFALIPVQVNLLSKITEIACGANMTLALAEDGLVYSWGNDWFGDPSSSINSNTPKQIPNPPPYFFTAITASAKTFYALRDDGKLFGWGDVITPPNPLPPTAGLPVYPPTQINASVPIYSISCGNYFLAVISSGNKLYCRGLNNFGQLGNGTTVNGGFAELGDMEKTAMVACGNGFTIAVKLDGTFWGWGRNSYGMLLTSA
ncbi:MAG: hypothetical protein WC935_00575 [Thermoleophilia bacterium]